MNPGIYEHLPFAEYRAIPAWNPSLVVSGLTSMLQLQYDRTHDKEPTPAMLFGSAIHCSVLEPDEFPKRYCLWQGAKRGKDFDVFKAANAGRDIIGEDQYDACLAARNAVRQHPRAIEAMANAKHEVSLVWTNRETGLLCKGRLDILNGCIADLKSTTAAIADDRAISRVATDLRYHVKMAAYQEGVKELIGKLLPVKFVFVEQDPPHDVRVKVIPPGLLACGWDKWQEVLHRIVECEKSGVWPGCDAEESPIEIWGENPSVDVTLDGAPLV